MPVKIEGTCEPRFQRVREIFADSFENGIEVGAAVAAVLDGKTIFDLWGGYADKAKTRPWTRDTLVNVWSTTKGITSICAHRLVDQGKLDLDAPVAKYWPEFAQAGKDKIPVNFLLSHRAGLPAVRKQLPADAYTNWPVMCAATRGAGALVGAGDAAWLSCDHVWIPRGRGDSANHRQDSWHLFARRNRGAAQARCSHWGRREFRSANRGADRRAAATAGPA